MTTTKATDRNGNTIYEVRDGAEVVGYVHKCSGYYRAELPNGSGRSVTSVKKGVELISFWLRMAS